MILLAHPTGNEYVRNAATALREAGLLKEFWTCVSWDSEASPNRFLPGSFRRQLARRSFSSVPKPLIRTTPWREIGRFVSPALGARWLTRHERGFFSVDSNYRAFDRSIARRVNGANDLRAIFCGEDYSLESFRAAQRNGVRRIYELPIGYWRLAHEIYDEESIREPEWAGTLVGRMDSDEKLERKEEELRLAEVVMVASTFTKMSLGRASGFSGTIHVVPYGAPTPSTDFMPARTPRKLRVLFVGSLGQRKGLSYLLDAVKLLGDNVELTLIGRKAAEGCKPLDEATALHQWIPSLSHAEILAEMWRHDVLVLPSLFEGFGLVILEAMSQGLPVITTEHTAGPDILTDGVDGFLVPVRSKEGIGAKLDLLAGDPRLLAEMKQAALQKAKVHSWANYRERIGSIARDLLSDES